MGNSVLLIIEDSSFRNKTFHVFTMHNGPAVNQDAPVVKIFHVNQEVATGAYYPKLEFENHKKTIFLLVAQIRTR